MATPVIEAGDVQADSGGATTSPDPEHQAYVAGDLLIQFLGGDDDLATDSLTAPANGPNGETLIVSSVGSGGHATTGPVTGVIAWVGNDTVAAGTLTWARGNAESWSGRCIKIPAGEFDSVTPIGTVSTHQGNSDSSGTTAPTPTMTAGASDGSGKILVCICVDLITFTGTVSGWTILQNIDDGGQGCGVVVRDAAASNSESISSVDYTVANDSSSCIGLIVRDPDAAAGGHPVNPFGHALNGPLGGPM